MSERSGSGSDEDAELDEELHGLEAGAGEAGEPAGPEPEHYDGKLDDKDEAWAVKQRGGHTSDALLSCPCCLTTLCIDCQQHERYHTQYRAMFVSNVRVSRSERLRVDDGESKRTEPEVFHPVHCATCDTQVAVVDIDEVYHFFNVLATTA